MLRRLWIILEMIKIEHTVFALPFALCAALVAARSLPAGFPSWAQLGWILLAMVGARSSAMTFNRLVDQEIDLHNPRTATRALPAGVITRGQAWIFTLVTTALFVLASGMLNRLALLLSPLALLIIWGYSYTKRFMTWSHVVLGVALGIAPSAAWIAITGTLALPALVLSAAVVCWTAGFDIIYACQDIAFDRESGLYSLPATFGVPRALVISSLLHAMAFTLLVVFGWLAALRFGYGLSLLPVAALLFWQHRLVHPDDLSRINAAFFTTNGLISLVLLIGTTCDVLVGYSHPY